MCPNDDDQAIAQLEVEYRRRYPLYEAFADKLRLVLCDVLESKGMAIVQSESRAKQVESFVGKVERKGADYIDPLVDVTDLAGVRIITYYAEDSLLVGELLRAEFDVDDERSVLKGDELAPDQFGYVSDHYIIRLKAPRDRLSEWSSFAGLLAEIQVRTVTQHAWAAIEHRLGYKTRDQLPKDVRRRLFRLSALFELADEQFSGARAAAEEVHQEYTENLRGGNLDVPIDLTSLEAYVAESPRVAEFARLVVEAGALIRTTEDGTEPGREQRDRSDLITTLGWYGISKLSDLDELLSRAAEVADRYREYVLAFRRLGGHSSGPRGFIEDMLNVGVFLLLDESSAEDIGTIYNAATRDAILEVRGLEAE